MERNLVIINQTTQSNDINQIKRNLSDSFCGVNFSLTIIKLNVKVKSNVNVITAFNCHNEIIIISNNYESVPDSVQSCVMW